MLSTITEGSLISIELVLVATEFRFLSLARTGNLLSLKTHSKDLLSQSVLTQANSTYIFYVFGLFLERNA